MKKNNVTAVKTWRRLDGKNQLSKVITIVIFQDGSEVMAHNGQVVA